MSSINPFGSPKHDPSKDAMHKQFPTFGIVLVAVAVVVGVIATAAITSQYSGSLNLKVSPSGIELSIDGQEDE